MCLFPNQTLFQMTQTCADVESVQCKCKVWSRSACKSVCSVTTTNDDFQDWSDYDNFTKLKEKLRRSFKNK